MVLGDSASHEKICNCGSNSDCINMQAMAALMILIVSVVANETARPFDEARQNYRWANDVGLIILPVISVTAHVRRNFNFPDQNYEGTGHGVSVTVEVVCWIVLVFHIYVMLKGMVVLL